MAQLLTFLLSLLLLAQSASSASREAEDMATSVERVTRELLRREYRLSPLGEGLPPDADPRVRFDAFDCTTFTETALALALAEGTEQVLPWLDRIRYEGAEIAFEARRHLMVAQWLPGLQNMGLLREATDEVAGQSLPRVRLELDLERWQRRTVARELELPESRVPVGTYELPYLPLDRAVGVLESSTPGLLLNVVRVPTPNAPIVITHQALLLDGVDGRRVVRHASGRYGRVIDQSVREFVGDLERPHAWPIAGINVQSMTRP